MIAIPSAWLAANGTIGNISCNLRPSMYSGNCGPGTLVTTRLNIRCRALSRAAWATIVGCADPVSSGLARAPTPPRRPGGLDADHHPADRPKPRRGIGFADRQRRPHRRDAVAERAALD